MLALGDAEDAFTKLETVVRHEPEQVPELVMFLIDAFIDAGRYDRAISIADLLVRQRSSWGDQARFKKVLAMWKQASAADSLRGFPERAIKVAREIQDKHLQEKVAEILGVPVEGLFNHV